MREFKGQCDELAASLQSTKAEKVKVAEATKTGPTEQPTAEERDGHRFITPADAVGANAESVPVDVDNPATWKQVDAPRMPSAPSPYRPTHTASRHAHDMHMHMPYRPTHTASRSPAGIPTHVAHALSTGNPCTGYILCR